MLADVLMWAEDNLVLVGGGVLLLIMALAIAATLKKKASAPIAGGAGFAEEVVAR